MTNNETSNAPNDSVNVIFYKKENGKYKNVGKTETLKYTLNGKEKYVLHANGSTYYKNEKDEEFLFVTTKTMTSNGVKNTKYLLKYKINFKDMSLDFVGIQKLCHNVIGITYDNKNFYISDGNAIYKYDSGLNLIRGDENKECSSIFSAHSNQDIAYHNGNLYLIHHLNKDNYKSVGDKINLDLKAWDSLVSVINTNGKLVDYMVFRHSIVGQTIKDKKEMTYKEKKLSEIEEIVFIDGKAYYFIQNSGNFVLYQATLYKG